MKFLIICEGGNVRSVAMAQLLKEQGHEAIAIGMKYCLYNSFKLFEYWADEVIDMRKFLPVDKWHNPRHPNLKKEVQKIWKQLEEKVRLE